MTPYKDSRWKVVRPQILERDRWTCQIKLAKCRVRATAVDHIEDWRDGGAWIAAENLRAACQSCNTSQRNSRVAARARAHRGDTSSTGDTGDPTDYRLLTYLSWLTPEEERAYGPLPGPEDPPRRVRRIKP